MWLRMQMLRFLLLPQNSCVKHRWKQVACFGLPCFFSGAEADPVQCKLPPTEKVNPNASTDAAQTVLSFP